VRTEQQNVSFRTLQESNPLLALNKIKRKSVKNAQICSVATGQQQTFPQITSTHPILSIQIPTVTHNRLAT